MTVAAWLQTNFTTQDPTTYKGSIDGDLAVLARAGDAFAPHAQATPNMTVALDAGFRYDPRAASLTAVAAQSTGAITAPVSNSRIDRVVIDAATGAVSVITGTPGVSPAVPALTAGKLPVAQVLLTSASTAIANSMITDERAVWGAAVAGIPWSIATASGDAYSAAYLPANAALYDGLLLGFRAPSANTTTTPSFAPDGLTAYTVTKLGGQAVAAGDIPGALAECLLRYNLANTRWELLNPAAVAVAASPVRQCVQTGSVASTGAANFLSAGSGLAVNLAATAVPVAITFANGFGARGASDNIGTFAADQAAYWSSLPASNLSYLSIDRDTGSGALSATSSLVPPQDGPLFDATRQALLHFENNANDDWGNSWTNTSGTYSGSIKKFGAYSWQGDGSTAYFGSTALTPLSRISPTGSWTIETWVYWTALPTASNTQAIFALQDASNTTALVALTNVAGTTKTALYLSSSSGVPLDLASNLAGIKTSWSTGTWYHFALSFDGATYRLFVTGTLDSSVSSGTRIYGGCNTFYLGVNNNTGTPLWYLNGNLDEFRISPCARYTANFTAPSAAFAMDGDWLDTTVMAMTSNATAGPAWSAIERVYAGECVAGSSSISSVATYAYQGCFIGPWTNTLPSGGALTTAADNLGTKLKAVDFEIECLLPDSAAYLPGDQILNPHYSAVPSSPMKTRNTVGLIGPGGFYAVDKSTGTDTALTAANWRYRFLVRRSY